MKQRVNIQYSVDMKELPGEICRLLQKSKTTLENICEEEVDKLSSFQEDEVLSIQTLDVIEEMRKKLAAADYILNDATSIINGFINYKVAPQNKEPVPQETSDVIPEYKGSESPINEEVMADLKSRIDGFRKDAVAKKALMPS